MNGTPTICRFSDLNIMQVVGVPALLWEMDDRSTDKLMNQVFKFSLQRQAL